MSFCGCTNNATHTKSAIELPNDMTISALGLNELNHYNEYDFCLVYLEHLPFQLSYSYEMYFKNGKLFSYMKYMNNVVSASYPPISAENNDSIYYSVTYKHHEVGIHNTIKKLVSASGFYNITSPDIPFESSHDSRWLIIYDKNKGIHSVYNWDTDNAVEQTIIRFIKDELMKYSDKLENELNIEGPLFETHIPPNRQIP